MRFGLCHVRSTPVAWERPPDPTLRWSRWTVRSRAFVGCALLGLRDQGGPIVAYPFADLPLLDCARQVH